MKQKENIELLNIDISLNNKNKKTDEWCCLWSAVFLINQYSAKVNVSLTSHLDNDLFLHLQCELAVLTVCWPEHSVPVSNNIQESSFDSKNSFLCHLFNIHCHVMNPLEAFAKFDIFTSV